MELTLRICEKRISVAIPGQIEVLEVESPNPRAKLTDEEEIHSALSNPLGSKKLEDLVSSGEKVAILFDDHTRPTPISKIAPIILDKLEQASVKSSDITFVMATGFHAANQEIARVKLGERIFRNYKVVVHDALDERNMSFCGVTSFGTPVWINSEVAKADVKIALGRITAHNAVGYSGGAKIILPGVSSIKTIDRNHFLYIAPQSKLYTLEGNPLREDIEEAAKLAKLDFIFNTILNAESQIVHAVAGDPFHAFRNGVRLWEKAYEVKLPRKANIAIVSPSRGGRYLVDALYAAVPAEYLTEDDGTIITWGSCDLGWAPESGAFVDAIFDRNYPPKSLMRLQREDLYKFLVEHKIPCSRQVTPVLEFKRVIEERNVILVSRNIPKDEALSYGITPAKTIREALRIALRKHGRDAFLLNIFRPGIFYPSFNTSQ
jgi:nickel-dependent lactate racemase